MKNAVLVMLCIPAVVIAVCMSSCDRQKPQTETQPTLKEIKATQINSPAIPNSPNGMGKRIDAQTALTQATSVIVTWDDGKGGAAKQQLSELVELHKSLSKTPGYGNALVSAEFEMKLCNNIVPALVSGHLSSAEAQSMLAVIAANRFSKSSLITMLGENAPDSKQARKLIADLESGKPVNLVKASDALLREQGASFFDVPTLDSLGELLEKPNPARAVQYHLMGAAKLDVASVIAEYASMGGDLKANDAILASDLQRKVPNLINAPGRLTNRPMDVRLIIDFLRDWRNGSFAK